MTDRLTEILGKKNITYSSDELSQYSVAGRMPTLVLFPSSSDQIAEIVKLARREGKKILIAGNNSQRLFGSAVENFDWCVSLNRMTHIVEHEAADLIATVEAGVRLGQLQNFLRQHRQFLPIDAFDAAHRTVGGIVASNSNGPLRLRYGTVRDLVLGMTVVLADGTIVRAGGKTVKNVAGYDLSKMFIGSMGTLGIITSITFKLYPLPDHSQTLWIEFDQLAPMAKLLRELSTSNLVICRCEFLSASFIDKFELNAIRSQAPQGLLLNVHGPIELVESTMNQLRQLATNHGGKSSHSWQDVEEAQLWDQILCHGSMTTDHRSSAHCQIATPKSAIIACIQSVQRYGNEQGVNFAFEAQACSGMIHIFWDEPNGTALQSQIETLRRIAHDFQGHMIVNRLADRSGLAMDQSPELIWGAPGSDFLLMKRIKANYDPHGIFAAGRFIGGL